MSRQGSGSRPAPGRTGTTTTTSGSNSINNEAKTLAKDILVYAGNTLTFPLGTTSDGKSAKWVLEQIRDNGYSQITSSDSNKAIGTHVSLSINMLKAIKDALSHGVHLPINCLTNGGHVGNSNHYEGNAVDFDGGMSNSDFQAFDRIAQTYNGAHNFENPQNNGHWHYDFTGGSTSGNGGSLNGGGGGTSDAGHTAGQLAIATGFTGQFSFGGLFNGAESQSLRGERGMMNDVPLFPFIEELAGASLREIMSLPDGRFYAFYPDYFGSLGKHAYWQIADVEIIDGRIDLSDDELYTHIFVVGDTTSNPDGVISLDDKLTTGGVITLFNAFSADFLNGTPTNGADANYPNKPTFKNDRNAAITFLQKYGARPKYIEEPAIRAPVYEAFRAYQQFCLHWAKQFKTTFEFTFMPELYPGGIIAFPEHGLQCYVQSVTHNCSYTNGFTTNAELIAPSSIKTDDGTPMDPDRLWVHSGMVRALNNDEVAHFNPTTMPLAKNKGKWKASSL